MKCKECKWWDESTGASTPDSEKCGRCHRAAPLPRLCFDENMAEDANRENICCYSSEWPYTLFNDWCGEFINKE